MARSRLQLGIQPHTADYRAAALSEGMASRRNTAPSHFRTTNGQLFSNRRHATWRLIRSRLKVNIMFRNERPSTMNMSFGVRQRFH